MKWLFIFGCLFSTVFIQAQTWQTSRPSYVSAQASSGYSAQPSGYGYVRAPQPYSIQQAPTACPSGCGCQAPCYCGCMQGGVCTCQH